MMPLMGFEIIFWEEREFENHGFTTSQLSLDVSWYVEHFHLQTKEKIKQTNTRITYEMT